MVGVARRVIVLATVLAATLTPVISYRSGMSHDDGAAPITVVQWNILADGLADDYFVAREIDADAVAFAQRFDRVVQVLIGIDADVVCLQELNHVDFFRGKFADSGYDLVWMPKPKPAIAGMDPDGVAIAYKTDRFERVGKPIYHVYGESPKDNQVLAIVHLRDGDRSILVANTHLKSKKGFEEVRRRQASEARELILATIDEIGGVDGVIFAGDFNTEGGVDEPVYKEMLAGGFTSAYGVVNGAEPSWTTWKTRWNGAKYSTKKAVEDFVFFAGANLRCVEVASLPDDDAVPESRYPTTTFPSDHFHLRVRFQFQN
ncbi:Nocturnin [Plasmodiophora brassicae]